MFERKKYITDAAIEKLMKYKVIKLSTTVYKSTAQGFRDYGKDFPLIPTLNPELEFYFVLYDGSTVQLDCTKLAKTYKINSVYINSVKVR